MTENIYNYPVALEHVQKIITNSPAHVKYTSKVTGETYDLRCAVDFLCAEGTPVLAAADGIVLKVLANVTAKYSGYEKPPEEVLPEALQDGNFVILIHKHGELSICSHLSHVLVTPGQQVKTGESLGLSGHTGWSIKPHVHFMVFRFLHVPPRRDFESLKIKFSE